MGERLGRSVTASGLALALLFSGVSVPRLAIGAESDDAELKKAFEQAGLEWFDGTDDKGRKGKKQAASPPAGSGDSPEVAPPPSLPGAPVVRPDVRAPDPVLEVEAFLHRMAKTFADRSLGVSDEEWEEGVDKGWRLMLGAAVLALMAAEARGDDTSDLEEAMYALTLFALLRPSTYDAKEAADVASPSRTTTDEGTTTAVPVAEPKPPEMKPKWEKQGRVWVSLPVPATIDTGRSKTPQRTLKTGLWYQVRIDADGGQVFYSKKGKYLGTKPRSDTDRVQVEVWTPSEE